MTVPKKTNEEDLTLVKRKGGAAPGGLQLRRVKGEKERKGGKDSAFSVFIKKRSE